MSSISAMVPRVRCLVCLFTMIVPIESAAPSVTPEPNTDINSTGAGFIEGRLLGNLTILQEPIPSGVRNGTTNVSVEPVPIIISQRRRQPGPEPPAQVFFDYSNVQNENEDDGNDDEQENDVPDDDEDREDTADNADGQENPNSQLPMKAPVSGKRSETGSNVETAHSRGEHVDTELDKGSLQQDARFDAQCDPYDDRDGSCHYGNGCADRAISAIRTLLSVSLMSLLTLYLHH